MMDIINGLIVVGISYYLFLILLVFWPIYGERIIKRAAKDYGFESKMVNDVRRQTHIIVPIAMFLTLTLNAGITAMGIGLILRGFGVDLL